jgi:hypothetical protein
MVHKFSDNYIKYVKTDIDDLNSDEIFNITKNFLVYDSKLSYQWNNISSAILFDPLCKKNNKIINILNDCNNLEKIIMNDNFTQENINKKIVFPSEHYIVKFLFPHLDLLDKHDIDMLLNAIKIDNGPLYDQMKEIRLPKLFNELFNYINTH